MIKQLFFGLLLGFITTLFLAQFDPWVKQQVSTFILHIFRNSFQCNATGSVESCRLFPLAITMRNVAICSPNKEQSDWSWNAATFVMSFSWASIIMRRTLDTSIVIDTVHAYSGITDGKLAILPHVRDLVRGPKSSPVPLILKTVHMQHASVTIDNGFLKNNFYWNGESRRIGRKFCSQFYVYDGSVANDHIVLVKNITGSISLETIERHDTIVPTAYIDGRGELPQLKDYPVCFITGRWFDQQGRFQIQSIDNSLTIAPLIVAERNNRFHVDATISAPMSYVTRVGIAYDPNIQGTAHMHVRGDILADGNGECQFICEDMAHPWFADNKTLVRSTITKRGLDFTGSYDIHLGKQSTWHGVFDWHGTTNQGTAHITNTASMPLWQSWMIKPKMVELQCSYNTATRELEGTITGAACHKSKEIKIPIIGSYTLDNERHIMVKTHIGDYEGMLDAWYDKKPRIEYMKLCNNKGHTLIDCHGEAQKNRYAGRIDIALLRLLCDTFFHYDVHSEGTLLFNAWLKDYCLCAHMQLKDATVRLPQTLNFMQDCTAWGELDFATRTITMRNIRGALHTGTFYIPTAIVQLDTQGALQFLHVPLLIDHCLFTMKHDLFAMVSGSLLLQKWQQDDAKLTGNIILDRSQLKENLFSASVQKKLFQFSDVAKMMPPLPLLCDITLETKEPVRVDTNFLEANAHVSLQLHHYLTQPTLSGFISVPSGLIRFPYKPLQLTKGEITFLPEQSLNPLIEIVAKNNIKNHNITLHVTGSLADHMVLLESTPPLTEEQIVGLLIAGAHEESLQAIIPSLLMQNVTNYIFSSHKSDFFDRYIKPWMKKINVQLKPHFNEQSGRGGLRGALEIMVNERWRALIEKNFTLTEDTRFELEYILSDDVTFRVIRDERCDIGAEVEMKWKF